MHSLSLFGWRSQLRNGSLQGLRALNEICQQLAASWRDRQDEILREIALHQNADHSYMEAGITLLQVAQQAQEMFLKRPAEQTRRLLKFRPSNSTWQDGELHATFKQPFDLIPQTANDPSPGSGDDGTPIERPSKWLGRKVSNFEMAISRNRFLSPVRDELQNPITSEFINVSKHSNFENRTECIGSRASERNEPFGEESAGLCRSEVRSSNQKSLLILGLITQHPCAENPRPRRRWRSERDSNRGYGHLTGHGVEIEPGLQRPSPKNGNIWIFVRRLSAIWGRKAPNLESGD